MLIDELRLTLFKVKKVCAEPASLSRRGGLDIAARQGQDSWRPEEMQELPKGDEYVSQPPAGLHFWFSVGVYSLTPRVTSYRHTSSGFDDMTCLHINITEHRPSK